jgi:hypothetical protein
LEEEGGEHHEHDRRKDAGQDHSEVIWILVGKTLFSSE